MNKLILAPILLIIAGILLVISIPEDTSPPESKPIYNTGFTFYDVEKIQTSLEKQNISMTTPTAITDHTIPQYCTYFDGQSIQNNVEYCTTTSIMDSDGEPIGNINMGGTTDGPIMALAIIDSSPFLDSKLTEIDIVFQVLIETLVCDCWAEKQPGGFESVSEWLNTAKAKYDDSIKFDSKQNTLKSKIDGLNGMNLILEITSKDESYLWTLIVLK